MLYGGKKLQSSLNKKINPKREMVERKQQSLSQERAATQERIPLDTAARL